MSINLQLKDANLDVEPDKQLKLQYIPASVSNNSPANVDEYFNKYTEETDGKLSNALRGYPLDGCQFAVPSPFQGIVFQEVNRPMDENTERSFKVNGVFNNFIHWNYNREPSANDQLKQAMQWPAFANVLHKPVTMDEYEMVAAKEEKS